MARRIISILSFLAIVCIGDAQNVLVSGAVVGNGSYPTLAAAFAAINSGAQTNAVIHLDIIQDTYEGTASAVLNPGTWTRITVAPAGGPRTIVGATAPGQALIDLNGADRVRFEGLWGGQKGLTISNTAVSGLAGTATVRFGNAAQYNRFSHCRLLGSSLTAMTVEGGTVLMASTNTTGGNSYNCIQSCAIGPTAEGLPSKAIQSRGAVTVSNVADSLVGCTVYDYFDGALESVGLRVEGGNVNWRVLDNHFYQTGSRTKTIWTSHSDILIGGTVENQGHVVNGNFLGGTDSTGAGMAIYHLASGAAYVPLSVSTGNMIGSNTVAYNTITHIKVNAVSAGNASIPFAAARIGGRTNFQYNVIGSSTDPGSIDIQILNGTDALVPLLQCATYFSCYIADNQIGGAVMSNTGQGAIAFFGINAFDKFSEAAFILRNQIGFATAPITVSTGGPTTQITGIRAFSDDIQVDGNTIAYIQSNAPILTNQFFDNFTGMRLESQSFYGGQVRGNHIHSLTSTNPSSSVKMLGIKAENINWVERNFIHSLSTQGPASQITGIAFGQGGMYISNNMVQLGLDGAGNSLTAGQALIGLRNDCCLSFVTHNSVYIGGHGVGGAAHTYAMSELPVITGVGIRRIQNNIFFNARSNGAGTGRHYAIGVANSAATHLQSNGNLLAAHGAGAVVGRFNNQDYPSLFLWRTAFNQDLNSISADPRFIQPAGSALTVDLHVVTPPLATPIEGAGQTSLTHNTDFDLEQRHLLTPVDIGADAGNFGLELLPTTPEVELQGNGLAIAAGDTTPSAADQTDYGALGCSVQSSGVFVVLNTGLSPLSIGNFTLSGNPAFVLTPPTTTTLAPGQSTSFTVAFNPILGVQAQATVGFTSNDPDEGSYSFAIQGFLAQDTTPPQAICQPITVALGVNGQGVLDTLAAAALSTDNCGHLTSSFSATQFTCSQLGLQPVTLHVTDPAGNADSCGLQVNVVDALAPQALCQSITLPLDAGGTAQLPPSAIDAGSTDNCGIDSMWVNVAAFTCAQAGVQPVQLSVRDGAGHVSTCTATVTLQDGIAPAAMCQPATLQLDAAGQATLAPALIDGGSSDNCSIAVRVPSQLQFSCADVGVRPVVLTVTDPAGNSATCSTQVTVQDQVAPVLACANLTVTVPSSGVATLTPGMVGSATDACGIGSYQLSQTQFSCQQVGTSPVRLIATDVHGNADTCIVVLTAVTAPLAVALNAAPAGPCGHHIACAGLTTGSASASVSGACAPYTYAWSNGQTAATATGLGAGTHTVTVTAANGQQQVQAIQLTAPAPLVLGMSATPSCSSSATGGTTATATGGQSCQAYTYLWSNGATTDSISGLAAGNYTVTVTDASGCTSTASTTVGTWPASSIAITQQLASLIATPGFAAYQWYNISGAIPGATAAQFTPLVTDSYFVVATDAFGCEWTSATFPFIYVAIAPSNAPTFEARLAPNPNQGVFQLILANPINEAVVVNVTDLRGRQVHVAHFASLQSGQRFDLSGLAAGAYFLTVETSLGVPIRLKFVRE